MTPQPAASGTDGYPLATDLWIRAADEIADEYEDDPRDYVVCPDCGGTTVSFGFGRGLEDCGRCGGAGEVRA